MTLNKKAFISIDTDSFNVLYIYLLNMFNYNKK